MQNQNFKFIFSVLITTGILFLFSIACDAIPVESDTETISFIVKKGEVAKYKAHAKKLGLEVHAQSDSEESIIEDPFTVFVIFLIVLIIISIYVVVDHYLEKIGKRLSKKAE